jgi:hypothetical protein
MVVARSLPRRERPCCGITDAHDDAHDDVTNASTIVGFAPSAMNARCSNPESINIHAAPRRYVAVMNYAAVMKKRRFAYAPCMLRSATGKQS